MSRRAATIPLVLALALAGPGLPGWAASRPNTPIEKPAAVKAAIPAPLPAPVKPVAENLRAVVVAAAQEQKPGAAKPDGTAAAEFFDVRSPKAVAAGAAVVLAGAATGGAALPVAYSLARFSGEKPLPLSRPRSFKSRLIDQVEAHAALPAAAFALTFIEFMAKDSVYLPALFAGVALATSIAMEDMVRKLRARVVGGWQASHDQKFRIDPSTGKLKDVRGTLKRYGEDRYERYASGEITRGERLWYRAAAASLGLYWTGITGDSRTLIFSALLAAGFAARDLYRFTHKPVEAPLDAEDEAHARRFNPDQ